MIYIRVKFLCGILLICLLCTTYAQPALNLRQKLERLLQDAEYNEAINEIETPQQTRGMLLKSLREHDLFDTSSEEKFFNKLNNYARTSKNAVLSREPATSLPPKDTMANAVTTTTSPTTISSLTKFRSARNTLTSEHISGPVIGGIESLSSIINKLIDMWKNSL